VDVFQKCDLFRESLSVYYLTNLHPFPIFQGTKFERMATSTRMFAPGDRIRLTMGDGSVTASQWEGNPGSRLSFSPGDTYTVNEVQGVFFDTTRWTTLWVPFSAAEHVDPPSASSSAPAAAAAGQPVQAKTADDVLW
jgi:hypothetical protein